MRKASNVFNAKLIWQLIVSQITQMSDIKYLEERISFVQKLQFKLGEECQFYCDP